MGLNVHHTLMLENANLQFLIPDYTNYNIDSFYLRSLEKMNEYNHELRQAHLEFYCIDNEYLSENALSSIIQRVNKIFNSILDFIKKCKNAVIASVKAFVNAMKKKDLKDDNSFKKNACAYYENDKQFTLNMYSNSLSDAFVNPNDPPVRLDFIPEDKFNQMQDFIFDIYNQNPLDIDDSIEMTRKLSDDYRQLRLDFRQKLVGASTKSIDDNQEFKNSLIQHYIGAKMERKVNLIAAINASENLPTYDSLIKTIKDHESIISKDYDNLDKRIRKFRDNMLQMISSPEKHAKQEEYQLLVTKVAAMAITMSNIINGICNDHLMAFSVKMDCVNEMIKQDQDIIARVKSTFPVHESSSYMISQDKDVIELEEAYRDLYESCMYYNEALSQLQYRTTMNALLEIEVGADAEKNDQQQSTSGTAQTTKTTTKSSAAKQSVVEKVVETFKRAVEAVRRMFAKFAQKLRELPDRKWLEQNKDALANLELPSQNDTFEDWTTFNIEALNKSLNIPEFNPTNQQLMQQLESDESFAEVIYKAIGTVNESKLKGDESFIDHCKGLYGISENGGKIAISKVQTQLPNMLEYCNSYVSNGTDNIPNSIEADMKKLDRSKSVIERVLKEARRDISSAETTKTSATTTSQTAQNTTSEQTPKSEATNIFGIMVEDTDMNFSAAEIFGLVHEVKTPKAEDSYAKDAKENVKSATGGDIQNVNTVEEKAMRYFKMVGNALGARMTMSLKAHRQYMEIFHWALKSENQNVPTGAENKADTNKPAEGGNDNIESEPLVK